MKVKIDENLPSSVKELLIKNGHDCHNVYDEDIAGGSDDQLISICNDEQRILLTLDLDFSDIIRYPPREFSGIVVLRLSRQDVSALLNRLEEILPLLEEMDLSKHLVIINDSRVRLR